MTEIYRKLKLTKVVKRNLDGISGKTRMKSTGDLVRDAISFIVEKFFSADDTSGVPVFVSKDKEGDEFALEFDPSLSGKTEENVEYSKNIVVLHENDVNNFKMILGKYPDLPQEVVVDAIVKTYVDVISRQSSGFTLKYKKNNEHIEVSNILKNGESRHKIFKGEFSYPSWTLFLLSEEI